MADAQNERTRKDGRRRNRRGQRGKQEQPYTGHHDGVAEGPPVASGYEAARDTDSPALSDTPDLVRPPDIGAPQERMEVYCTHHMALTPEHEPFVTRNGMTTLRHLAVDRFGEATLFCDCLHSGPHEWPPSLQRLQTAIELDQFLTAWTRDA